MDSLLATQWILVIAFFTLWYLSTKNPKQNGYKAGIAGVSTIMALIAFYRMGKKY
jgi:hypothetical protein